MDKYKLGKKHIRCENQQNTGFDPLITSLHHCK